MFPRKETMNNETTPDAGTCTSEPPCSPPPYELACRMLNAIGWNGNDFRFRDPVAMAIAPEVERINRRRSDNTLGGVVCK